MLNFSFENIQKRKYFQVISRLHTQCDIIGPIGDYCEVKIPEVTEPFRIGIRLHGLRDSALGSFGIIADIEYTTEICMEPSKLIKKYFSKLYERFLNFSI